MWFTKLRRQWFGRLASRRRPARRGPASLRLRQLETRLTPSLITLASFNGTDGYYVTTPLVIDGSGNLYGTTPHGGAYNEGTVFELAQGSGTITTLASFDALLANGGLAMDSNGNLYGTASSEVFELAKGSGTITTLASLVGTGNGVVMDGRGNLYGTTQSGGAFGEGTVFELAAGSSTVTTLASFDYTYGAFPYAGLILDSSGNLYGTTTQGGASNYGTVYEVAKGSGAITALASFDAASPSGGVVMDSSGNLYGTTTTGGASGLGTVFELAKGSNAITTLASFNSTDGANPQGDLFMDGRGNLYGTTALGGTAGGYGAVFELAKGSNAIFTLASFNGSSDGDEPLAGLVMDSSGNLYGTTDKGGASSDGTVFEVSGAAAPTDQWTGANFAVDTNWSDGANWSLGSPPNPGQTALFTNNASVQGFTATVDAGFTNAIAGLAIDATWGGTISVNSPLSLIGNLTLASGSLGGSGAVTIGGIASQWSGGMIDLGSGGFTNTGTLTADTSAGTLVLSGAGTLTNDGTINESGTNSLVLENTATLTNAAGATFDLTNNGSVSQSGGTLSNAGTVEKTGGTGTSTITSTSLDNLGIVAVSSGTLDISASVTQVAGTALTAGNWRVTGSSTVHSTLDITSAGSFARLGAHARVTLSGLHSTFTNLSGLTTVGKGARFTLLGGQSFTTAGALTNNGAIILSPRSVLTVNGSFTQAATGTLTIELGGTDAAPTFGQLVSTSGTVTLAGSLQVTSTVVPAVGHSFAILDNEGDSATSGTFAGLPEGATFQVKTGTTTMTFKITYTGTDTDGNQNVLLKRIP
jgi:uncharacterized repeat protein (TIGR03803 family)